MYTTSLQSRIIHTIVNAQASSIFAVACCVALHFYDHLYAHLVK